MSQEENYQEIARHLDLQKAFLQVLGQAIDEECGTLGSQDRVPLVKSLAQDHSYHLQRDQLEGFINGPASAILGGDFADLDERIHRLRLPAPPFLFVSRVQRLAGKKQSLGTGSIEWEFTIPQGTCFEDRDQVSPSLLVESGHTVILLLSYLGFDAYLGEKGRFRALSNTTTFKEAVIQVGSTYRGITTIEKIFKTKDHVIFNLRTEGFLDDKPILWSTWQAGIIHVDFLKQKNSERTLTTPPVAQKFQDGEIEKSSFKHLKLVKEIRKFEPLGGATGQGELWLGLDLKPLSWVLDCHFMHDPVYPGILAIEAAFQGVMLMASKKGLLAEQRTYRFVPGEQPLSTRFGGEITENHQDLMLCLSVREIVPGESPLLVADVRIYGDSHLLGEAKGLSLRAIPTDPRQGLHDFPVGALGKAKSHSRLIPLDGEDSTLVVQCLEDVCQPYLLLQRQSKFSLAPFGTDTAGWDVRGEIPSCRPHDFGSARFRQAFGLQYAYMIGGMAHGISSEDMVIQAARAGFLASFGAAGLSIERTIAAVQRIKRHIATAPFAVNFIHQPGETDGEWALAQALIENQVDLIEASAFMRPSRALVLFRCAGLGVDLQGNVVAKNRIIAKISRPEVASHFLKPAPQSIVESLVRDQYITAEAAKLALAIPLVDALIVEADSGGHTDNRPMTILYSAIHSLVQNMTKQGILKDPIAIGVAGGIGCPEAMLAAFAMGADFVVTGSINQACVEAATSQAVKEALVQAGMADTAMAPSADMFEIGAKVQVLRRKNIFALRAQKLHHFYTRYQNIEAVIRAEPQELDAIFKAPIEQIWAETQAFWRHRSPAQLAAAMADEKVKMALIFRWYLGMSVHWALTQTEERKEDFQIWCGPAMGACNDWLKGSPLEKMAQRRVDALGTHLLKAAAFKQRLLSMAKLGVEDSYKFSYSFAET
jgi:PfaD family protein